MNEGVANLVSFFFGGIGPGIVVLKNETGVRETSARVDEYDDEDEDAIARSDVQRVVTVANRAGKLILQKWRKREVEIRNQNYAATRLLSFPPVPPLLFPSSISPPPFLPPSWSSRNVALLLSLFFS